MKKTKHFQKQTVDRKLTPQYFGAAAKEEKDYQQELAKYQYLEDVEFCEKACNHHGLCRNGKCYCNQGWVLADCSESDISKAEIGFTKTIVYVLGTLVLILFTAIGTLAIDQLAAVV